MEEQQLDISINSNKRILTEAELGIKIKTKVQKVYSFLFVSDFVCSNLLTIFYLHLK